LRKIAHAHAFVENEQWNVVHMKEEFHAKFVVILQTIYEQKRLAYFSNKIVITFDLANRGQHVNWCSTILTQFLVEFTYWTKCQQKATANPVSNKTKADNSYSKPILDILFRKWFPLFEVPSPRTTTLNNLCH
jgi:hypothetical protein